MSLDAIWHRRNPTPSVSVIKVSTVPGLLHVMAPWRTNWSVQLKMDISMKLQI